MEWATSDDDSSEYDRSSDSDFLDVDQCSDYDFSNCEFVATLLDDNPEDAENPWVRTFSLTDTEKKEPPKTSTTKKKRKSKKERKRSKVNDGDVHSQQVTNNSVLGQGCSSSSSSSSSSGNTFSITTTTITTSSSTTSQTYSTLIEQTPKRRYQSFRRPHKPVPTPTVQSFPTTVVGTKSSRARTMAAHDYDDSVWNVETCTNDRTLVRVSHNAVASIKDLVIPRKRLATFKQKCDLQKVNTKLLSCSACGPTCKLQCHYSASVAEVLNTRRDIYSITTLSAQIQTLVATLRANNPNVTEPAPNERRKNLQYLYNGRKVCGRFWAFVHGVSEDRMKKVRTMVRNGSTRYVHGNEGLLLERPQYTSAYAFWHNFFEENCQQPNDDLRLFPVNESFRNIYIQYFTPWYCKQMYQKKLQTGCSNDELPWKPSESTFIRARWDEDFKNVSRRARHYHVQCRKCNELKVRRMKGFINDEHFATWQVELECHEREKLGWRKLEKAREAEVLAPNSDCILLSYDDTTSFGLPRFSNRPIKNIPKSRFKIIPFNICNYASGENAYVYTVKGRYLKGGNRLCSTLYHYLRKIKWGNHTCRGARRLYLHADNASENKNNTVFCFLSELVYRGWFDEIIMEFGPPGHTHNGRDAVHHIHNRIAGNFYSFTIGEFQRCWQHSWIKEGTMPDAVIMDAQYDWDMRYQGRNDIQGFTKTAGDPAIALAFRFKRNTDGFVEMKFKHKHDSKWLGNDQLATNSGFVVLPQLPQGAPTIVEPTDVVMSPDHIIKLIGPTMQEAMRPYMASDDEVFETINWLGASADTGRMPYTPIDASVVHTPPDQWGQRVKVGVPGKQGDFFLIQPDKPGSPYGFWQLPVDTQERVEEEQRERQKVVDRYAAVPKVEYKQKRKAAQSIGSSSGSSGSSSGSSSARIGSDDSDGEVSNRTGASMEYCKVGHFAVLERGYKDGSTGIDVGKIKGISEKSVEGGFDVCYLSVDLYGPAGTSNRGTCLKSKWREDKGNKKGSKVKNDSVKNWSVIAYFRSFNKGGRLPKSAVDAVVALGKHKTVFSKAAK
jgi:hypothetical protein